MPKLAVITDLEGNILGTVRADPVKIGGGVTVQFHPSPSDKQKYHDVEVPESLLRKSAEDLHKELASKLKG